MLRDLASKANPYTEIGPTLSSRTSFGLALALCAALAGCSGAPDAEERLQVAVTIVPQAWLVEQLGGDRVSVTTLVTAGESPATYQPSDAQVSRLIRSAVFFRIGVACEYSPWFEAIERLGRVEIIDLRQGVGEVRDPHIWLSPMRLKRQARTVAETLERLDPVSRDHYRRRLAGLEERLDALDAELHQRLAPFAGRAFLVFHPSWFYFAEDYGLRQLALEIEGKVPSDAEITRLQRAAREEDLSVVFFQPQITGRAVQAVAATISGRTEMLDPLAADVAANLRRVADRLVASFE